METNSDNNSLITVGIYAHATRAGDTMRSVLNGFRRHASLRDAAYSKTSIEEAKERLWRAEFSILCESEAPLALEGFEAMIAMFASRPTAIEPDERMIERIADAADDGLPPAVALLDWHPLGFPLPLTVRYAAEFADMPGRFENRLIHIDAQVAPDWPREGIQVGDHDDWREFIVDGTWKVINERLRHVPLDYASVRRGGAIPSPRTIARSTHPEDFQRLLISASANEARELERAARDTEDWVVTVEPNGAYIVRQTVGERISAGGRAFMQAIRDRMARRFGIGESGAES